MVRVHVRTMPMDIPSVTVVRSEGHLSLVIAEGMCRDEATRMARSLLTLEERDAVRALFGVAPVAEVPEVEAAWGHLPPAVTNEAIDAHTVVKQGPLLGAAHGVVAVLGGLVQVPWASVATGL